MSTLGACSPLREGMPARWNHGRVGNSTQPLSLCTATVSDWARDKCTRKIVLAGGIRHGQHLLRSWSNDQPAIKIGSGEGEVHAACMATQQAMDTEIMVRELGVRLHGAATGRQCSCWNHRQGGTGESGTFGLELLMAAGSSARKASHFKSPVRKQLEISGRDI